MRRLGLIGGMSWESTTTYYQLLNRLVRERLGGRHSAELILWSVDFAPIADMQSAGAWDQATAVLADAARRLEEAGAEALLICANTMHLMADEVGAAVSIPVIHVGDATAAAIKAAGVKRPLLLATRYTMEMPFYRERLAANGVDARIPPQADRDRLQAIIFDELVQGMFTAQSKAAILDIIARAEGVDGVILACTEIGLLIGPDDLDLPLFDTTEIHARAGVEFALGSSPP
ncbi:MAG: aspartate/glutamate racemase family protein [Caulobacteraceae bacterium]